MLGLYGSVAILYKRTSKYRYARAQMMLLGPQISNMPFKSHVIVLFLDEIFVISRIIKVEVGVNSRSWRLRLIILTETLIILDITKTESNNCFIIYWTKQKKTHVCASSLTASKTKRAKLDMITQPKPKAEADNHYRDKKHLIQ